MVVVGKHINRLGACERLVLFEHRYGSDRSAQQHATMARGVTASIVVFFWGGSRSAGGRRGLIAALVFGEGA